MGVHRDAMPQASGQSAINTNVASRQHSSEQASGHGQRPIQADRDDDSKTVGHCFECSPDKCRSLTPKQADRLGSNNTSIAIGSDKKTEYRNDNKRKLSGTEQDCISDDGILENSF
jgi:hypothetical protein